MKYSGIGGQAVIEGVMMRNKDDYATAVRKSDGDIVIEKDRYVSMAEKVKFFSLPFIRGIFSFIDSLVLGMKTLTFSASLFEDDEEEVEPGRFEKWLDKVFGEKLEDALMAFAMVFAVIAAVVLFMVLPVAIANLLKPLIGSGRLMTFIEGILRLLIFIIYIKLISNMEDIQRTFMYHGAEHKCINCVEHGMPLTVDNVRISSRQHKRCGTSFLLFVMLISIIIFMLVPVSGLIPKIISRVLLIPVVAGISYEFLRLAGRSDNPVVNFLSKPGLWMQSLTTKEPDDSMIEVGIAATEAVFDWRKYLAENFNVTGIADGGDQPA